MPCKEKPEKEEDEDDDDEVKEDGDMDDSAHAAVAPASSVLSRVASSQVPRSWVCTLLQHQFHMSWCSLLGQEGEEVASPKAADSAGAPCVAVYLVLALQNGSISLEVDLRLTMTLACKPRACLLCRASAQRRETLVVRRPAMFVNASGRRINSGK